MRISTKIVFSTYSFVVAVMQATENAMGTIHDFQVKTIQGEPITFDISWESTNDLVDAYIKGYISATSDRWEDLK